LVVFLVGRSRGRGLRTDSSPTSSRLVHWLVKLVRMRDRLWKGREKEPDEEWGIEQEGTGRARVRQLLMLPSP
jgi:hypothetical protein